ncbi:MAG TPA: ABC transporter substrate-binding protein, partial [Vicinamibacterales bacterium]|nr:ABC transporter substrate-binding protein [Vicinamibacterales bacterium]
MLTSCRAPQPDQPARRRWRRAFFFLSTAAAAALAATAFVHTPTAQGVTTLRIGAAALSGGPQTGMPAIARTLTDEYLVALDPNGRPSPRLAQEWKHSDDGRTWRFRLARRAKFHDGSSADARTLAPLLAAAVRNPQFLQIHPGLQNVEAVVADGPLTIVVRMQRPRVLLIDELADLSLSLDRVGGSLGPFIVASVTAQELHASAFRDYFRGAPQLEKITYQTYRTLRAAWSALMRDEVDALYEVTRDAYEFVTSESRVRTYSFLRPYVSTVLFNVARRPLTEPSVRRALSHSISRQAIVAGAYRGRGQAADGPVLLEHWTLAGGLAAAPLYNPALADQILAGLPLSVGRDQMPSRVRFTCLVAPSIELQPFERVALLLQQQFYSRGIDMQIEAVSLAEMQRRILTGDFDAALLEFFGKSPSWLSAFWHSRPPALGGLVGSGYSAADSELDAMQLAKDEDELKRSIAAVYKKMHDDPPAIFIAWPEVT